MMIVNTPSKPTWLAGKSRCLIGDTFSFMVVVLLSFVLGGCQNPGSQWVAIICSFL